MFSAARQITSRFHNFSLFLYSATFYILSIVTAISFKPKATRKRLKKEILSDDFKKRKILWKIFRTGKFSTENFPPYITTCSTDRGVITP
jgi:hypothetical protein